MGKKSGKPGPDPRNELAKASLRLPNGSSFGGPRHPPLDEAINREKQALKDFERKVRGGR